MFENTQNLRQAAFYSAISTFGMAAVGYLGAHVFKLNHPDTIPSAHLLACGMIVPASLACVEIVNRLRANKNELLNLTFGLVGGYFVSVGTVKMIGYNISLFEPASALTNVPHLIVSTFAVPSVPFVMSCLVGAMIFVLHKKLKGQGQNLNLSNCLMQLKIVLRKLNSLIPQSISGGAGGGVNASSNEERTDRAATASAGRARATARREPPAAAAGAGGATASRTFGGGGAAAGAGGGAYESEFRNGAYVVAAESGRFASGGAGGGGAGGDEAYFRAAARADAESYRAAAAGRDGTFYEAAAGGIRGGTFHEAPGAGGGGGGTFHEAAAGAGRFASGRGGRGAGGGRGASTVDSDDKESTTSQLNNKE